MIENNWWDETELEINRIMKNRKRWIRGTGLKQKDDALIIEMEAQLGLLSNCKAQHEKEKLEWDKDMEINDDEWLEHIRSMVKIEDVLRIIKEWEDNECRTREIDEAYYVEGLIEKIKALAISKDKGVKE